MSTTLRILLTALVVAAAGAVAWKDRDYVVNPWTRNGQVRANVIQVAPRVSGPIVDLPIVDNQPVRIRLDAIPVGVALRVGTTASVLVMTGDGDPAQAPAVPPLLQ